jgi:UbiD family decarboxylase
MTPDTEKFRLLHFVKRLVQQGECVAYDAPIALIDVGEVLEGNPKAVWFKDVGPEHTQLVGNVMGSRKRLAMSLDAEEANFPKVLRDRVAQPHAPIEVPSSQAPVQQVVQIGDDADFGSLPVNLQHELDGGLYISAGIDYAKDPANGWTNVGCRRLMLRGPRAAGIDLNAPSDLRTIYLASVSRGEKLPVAFTVGSHPVDFLAAMAAAPPMDELHIAGAVRGAPMPIVNARRSMCSCRRMQRSCSRAISMLAASSNRRDLTVNTSATTASSRRTRYFT